MCKKVRYKIGHGHWAAYVKQNYRGNGKYCTMWKKAPVFLIYFGISNKLFLEDPKANAAVLFVCCSSSTQVLLLFLATLFLASWGRQFLSNKLPN